MVSPGKRTSDDEALVITVIDFGQAVDVNHPSASSWLKRDLSTVRDFFMRQGIKTLSIDEAEQFVTGPAEEATSMDTVNDRKEVKVGEGSIVHTQKQGEACDEELSSDQANKQSWNDESEIESLMSKLQGMAS